MEEEKEVVYYETKKTPYYVDGVFDFKKYREDHKAEIKERNQKYREANRLVLREKNKVYYEEKRDLINAKRREK